MRLHGRIVWRWRCRRRHSRGWVRRVWRGDMEADSRFLGRGGLTCSSADGRWLRIQGLLKDRIARGGTIRAAGRTTDRTGHEIVNGFDVEFVTRPAGALDFNFHGRILSPKLNGVVKTSCCRVAIVLSKSCPKYKRIFQEPRCGYRV